MTVVPPPPSEPPPTAGTPLGRPPAAPTDAPRSRRPGRRGRLVLAAVIAVVAAAAAVSLAVVHPGSSTPKTPEAVTDAYYTALAHDRVSTAYALLCDQQQQGPEAYASEVAADRKTGTGIKTWTRESGAAVQGDEAVVAGRLVLDDGESTPIHLLLLRQGGDWGVCTSDLGGILPPTGTGSTGSGGTQT